MNIIICGAGRVGHTIAKLLTEQNHSITLIDQSSEDIQKINDSFNFCISSLDWSIIVIEWFCSVSNFAMVKPTLPAPHIIMFIIYYKN